EAEIIHIYVTLLPVTLRIPMCQQNQVSDFRLLHPASKRPCEFFKDSSQPRFRLLHFGKVAERQFMRVARQLEIVAVIDTVEEDLFEHLPDCELGCALDFTLKSLS